MHLLRIEDIPHMVQLHFACFDVPWTAAAFEQMMQLPTTLSLGVYIINEKEESEYAAINSNLPPQTPMGLFVGFIMVSILSGAEAEILTLCVHPQYQRRGIARYLLQEFMESLYHFNCTHCYLDVAENNDPAIQLYKKFGFSIKGTRSNYYKNSKGEVLSSLLMTFYLKK